MACLSRIIVLGSLLVQAVAAGFGLLVLGSAGLLDEAAIINSTDAIVLLILLAVSLVATFVLAIYLWVGSRKSKRLVAELAALRNDTDRPGISGTSATTTIVQDQ